MKERVFKLIDSIKDMIYSQKYPVNEYLMIHSEKGSIDIPVEKDRVQRYLGWKRGIFLFQNNSDHATGMCRQKSDL